MIRVELGPVALAVDEATTGRMSFALFCPTCGELWGRVRQGEGWYSIARPCEAHGDDHTCGGSFFERFDWTSPILLSAMLRKHPNLRRHEFRVAMAWAERHGRSPRAPAQGSLL